MTRTAAALLALALTGSLAACGDDPDEPAPPAATSSAAPAVTPVTPTSPAATASAAASAGASPATPPGTAPDAEASAPVPFPADTSVDTEEPIGGPLTVRAVRVARQPGYDRVVFELAGTKAGAPGWRVEYVTDPRDQGSGEPVEVKGEAVLSVTLTGTGYPFDTGVDEVSGDPALPAGAQVVRDVVLRGVYEGQYDAFVGTATRAPFRVFRLEDPARVVVDVRVE